ncbi:MAG: HNH endonuclease [Anaerolineales bacterium]|nr:HNH endonuclease [Anaerolineales bacterium]
MDREEILDLFQHITVWKKGDQRAPHKPLLLLIMLARVQQGNDRLASYDEIEEPLEKLLIEFGPSRKSIHPELPFWYLQYDDLWELSTDAPFRKRPNNRQPSPKEFRDMDAHAGFRQDIYSHFYHHPTDLTSAAQELLYQHFPSTLHEDIADQIGLDLSTEREKQLVSRTVRDPAFRQAVLAAYEYRCAVCSWDIRIGDTPVGLEAAHIKWVQAGGPDVVPNGLSLCSLHHKLLDRGAITLTPEYRMIISEQAVGDCSLETQLPYHQNPIVLPVDHREYPDQIYLEWHRMEVYRG